jgi:hypothetical protein
MDGLLLRGTGGGAFAPVGMAESGIMLEGQVRDLKLARGADGGPLVVVARNGEAMRILRVRKGEFGTASSDTASSGRARFGTASAELRRSPRTADGTPALHARPVRPRRL